MKTKLHSYHFDISKPDQNAAYESLVARLTADEGRRFFNVYAMNGEHKTITGEVTLETKHLFADQWNTSSDSPTNPNARIFDWYEGIFPNKKIKQGHWLEITDEMRSVRQTTLICGYCGKNYANGSEGSFCTSCLDSAYLKETELHLLRLLPVGLFMPKRQPLAQSELEQLLPLYVDRQTKGNDSRAVKAKADARRRVVEKYTDAKDAIETEYKGFSWLLDHDISVDNVIFYSHTGKFCFGWRNPLSESVKSNLLDQLAEFLFDYEFATDKNR
jgi:hypothetical protein